MTLRLYPEMDGDEGFFSPYRTSAVLFLFSIMKGDLISMNSEKYKRQYFMPPKEFLRFRWLCFFIQNFISVPVSGHF